MPINVLMPALSPTMTEGNIASWIKKEGDKISTGDLLCEIETDKATMEIEAINDGILGKIITPDGTENVPVNAVIGIILEDGEEASLLDDNNAKAIHKPDNNADSDAKKQIDNGVPNTYMESKQASADSEIVSKKASPQKNIARILTRINELKKND